MAAVAVYIVRHAHAQPRDSWAGSDKQRPLTDRGAKEARAIVDHFDTGPPGGALSHDLGAAQPEPRPTLLVSSSTGCRSGLLISLQRDPTRAALSCS